MFLKRVSAIPPCNTPLTHSLTHATWDLCPVGWLKWEWEAEKEAKCQSVLEIPELLLFSSSNVAQSTHGLPTRLPRGWGCSVSLSPRLGLNLLAAGVESTPSFKMESQRYQVPTCISLEVWSGCLVARDPQLLWSFQGSMLDLSHLGLRASLSLELPVSDYRGGEIFRLQALSAVQTWTLPSAAVRLPQSGIFVPRPFPIHGGKSHCRSGNL